MKIYRKSTSEPYSFLTIDNTLPANSSLIFYSFIKMTLTDELKILDDKIKANQVHYDLTREAAKISVLSSKELDKYEYLSGEDLGYKPGVVEQAKFEYYSLRTFFNKGLEQKGKKEGLLKRLSNIEGKNEEQLEAIKDQGEKQLQVLPKKAHKKIDFKMYLVNTKVCKHKLNPESARFYNEIKEQNKKIDYTKLVCIGSEKQYHYNFTIFLGLGNFAGNIYNGNLSLNEAKIKQRNMEDMIRKLEYYRASGEKYKIQTSTLLNAKEFYKGRKMILITFENGIFPFPKQYPSESDWKQDEMDSSEFLPRGPDTLLTSFQHKEKTTKIVNKEKELNKK